MSKVSDVVITCFKVEWEVFADIHKYNPFIKCAKITEYPAIDIINVSWECVKWYTKDKYTDEIYDFMNNHSCLLTTLDEDNTLYQEDYIKSDDDVSDFWDYAPQVKLVL